VDICRGCVWQLDDLVASCIPLLRQKRGRSWMAAGGNRCSNGAGKGHAGRTGRIEIGDEILAVDGTPIRATGAMQAYLQAKKGAPVRLELLRQNQKVTLTITPSWLRSIHRRKSYRIGFGSEPMQVEKLPERKRQPLSG